MHTPDTPPLAGLGSVPALTGGPRGPVRLIAPFCSFFFGSRPGSFRLEPCSIRAIRLRGLARSQTVSLALGAPDRFFFSVDKFLAFQACQIEVKNLG
jgi:hypothetical protein